MSFTVKNVIDDVRPLVNDIEGETWGDPVFIQYLNEYVLLLYTDHPECRVQTAGTLKAYAALTMVGETVQLDDVYRAAAVEYLAYRFHDADAGDTHDKSRAAEHLQRFNDLVGPSK